MIAIALTAVWTLETPSPHPIDQLETDISQGEYDKARYCRRDRGINVHHENEIMNVHHFTAAPATRDSDVDGGVDTV